MKYINTGTGKLPLMSLIAILSISLTVNLPGLAISPIMDKLDQVFPHVSELEIQLLTILPNLVIIPFILWSGKLSTGHNQMVILLIGFIIYIFSGLMYFVADSMIQLIIISCLLGVGCGLIIPLAAGLIAQYFVGSERVKQLGIKSGLSNFMVIFANLFVGWIAALGWHLSFLVYLVPIIPLALIPFMAPAYINKHKIVDPNGPIEPLKEDLHPVQVSLNKKIATPTSPNFHFQGKQSSRLLAGIIILYIILTYCTLVVSYYIPFTMQHYKLNTGDVGIATAMYFLSATVAGFLLTRIISILKTNVVVIAISLSIVGLFMVGIFHTYATYIIGIFIMGFGYGIMQPIIYDKTTYISPNSKSATKYFSYVLTGNYVAISLTPFIVGLMSKIFDSHSVNFAYILNGSILVILLIVAIWKSNSYVFKVDTKLYESK